MSDMGEHYYRYSDLLDLKASGQIRPVKIPLQSQLVQ